MRPSLPWVAAAALLLSSSPISAQTFQDQPGAIPGPNLWSEGVEAFDANGDGHLDVIFTNGNGFGSGQGALAPTLLINQGIPGAAVFADETGTRIPATFAQQGKGLTIVDVDLDGDPDVVFANAFQTQPRLLINDGAGVFSDQTSPRLPVMLLGAFGVCAPDVDDDGDPDLVFCDTGPSTLGPPGGLARLLINDGTGNFTDAPLQMNAALKIGAMQVSAADIDNDFDLDIIVDGRSLGQHLYLNDGTGTFTFAGTGILPLGSSLIYETDWADLDGDTDIDGFYISLSGFNEGTARSDFAQSSMLSFVGSTATISGVNGNDDNECAFLDANDDGILDVVVASLSGAREKLYLNQGTFNPGSFVYQATGFTTLGDSTLDLAIGDFDGDDRYDVVTAQGESGSFQNRLYKNTGTASDTHAPTIGRIESLPATVKASDVAAGLFHRRAWIQDSVHDSGRNYISASQILATAKDGVQTSFQSAMAYSGGSIFRGVIQPASGTTGLVGMDVTVSILATDPPGNTSQSAAETVRICGSATFGTPSAANAMTLVPSSDPTIGQPLTLTWAGGPTSTPGALVVGPTKAQLPAAGGEILVDLATASLIPITTDASGAGIFSVSIPALPLFVAFAANTQVGFPDPTAPQGFTFSTGAEFAICGT